LFAQQLKHEGVSCISGLYYQGRFLGGPFPTGFDAAKAALQDPRTKSLLCIISSKELFRHGLPADQVRHVYNMPNNNDKPLYEQILKAELNAHVSGQWRVLKQTYSLLSKEKLNE